MNIKTHILTEPLYRPKTQRYLSLNIVALIYTDCLTRDNFLQRDEVRTIVPDDGKSPFCVN